MNAKLVLISRILLGLIFFIFGLNGLLMFTVGKGFIPAPAPTGDMLIMFNGLMVMKYLMPLVKLLEVLAGLMLLTNRFVNLGLVFLAPIVVNILGIHTIVDPSGAIIAILVTALFMVVFVNRFADFKRLFAKN